MTTSRHMVYGGSEARKAGHRSNIAATYSLCAVIALAPLPFGSMDQRVIAIWVLLLSAILVLASLQPLDSRDRIFLACFAIVVEQLSPAPIFAQLLTPSIWEETFDARNHQAAPLAGNRPRYVSLGISCLPQ